MSKYQAQINIRIKWKIVYNMGRYFRSSCQSKNSDSMNYSFITKETWYMYITWNKQKICNPHLLLAAPTMYTIWPRCPCELGWACFWTAAKFSSSPALLWHLDRCHIADIGVKVFELFIHNDGFMCNLRISFILESWVCLSAWHLWLHSHRRNTFKLVSPEIT